MISLPRVSLADMYPKKEKLILTIWLVFARHAQSFLTLGKTPRGTPRRFYDYRPFGNDLNEKITLF